MFPDRRQRALSSLRGLAVGDALGSQFFVPTNRDHLTHRTVPAGPWQWTDDTEMACSIYHVLDRHGHINPDALAASFAHRHDFDRGYGPATNRMLRLVREGGDWRQLSAGLFDGQGSYGNGAAMRVAPLGAWYADDLETVVTEAALSAQVTHTHPEAVAGAIAIAVAAALLANGADPAGPSDFLSTLAGYTPSSAVRSGIEKARDLPDSTPSLQAGVVLGNGSTVSAPDTVPLALWVVAHCRGSFSEAFWATASAGGDIDTTCAIVGGVLAARTGTGRPPADWDDATERLPHWISQPQ
ncbi:MAG TPA: ADP-ribosylglycohydrolase family protein [Micromonosporaceae bacterium]|nr:ADP-ribosylglycohydrolase family protein [Micromonosporaceae bacterium]